MSMKKLLFVFVLTLLMVLGVVATVSADNGPHGSFTATTDACANCHRAHSAQSSSNTLLVQSSAEALCTSCHGGTGASTDVEDGVYHVGNGTVAPNGNEGVDGQSLFGGGFINAKMATAWSGAATADAAFDAVSRATTSTHSLGAQGIVYGSGGINSTQATMALECTSCHDPHGTAGYTMTPNTTSYTWTAATPKVASYRLLRFQPAGSNGFTAPTGTQNWSGGAFPTVGTSTGWTVPDSIAANGAEWYTLGTTSAFAVGDYNAGSASNVYNVDASHNYINSAANVAYFCAQCHDRYFANTRLRNGTDNSAYCGTPGPTVTGAPTTSGLITLTVQAPIYVAGIPTHPVNPTRCVPVNSAAGAFVSWGDTGDTGDTVHKYMHSSGDVLRASTDQAYTPSNAAAMTAPTNIGRSCVACHVAHGTAAQMTTVAGQANRVYVEASAASSTLLRMDNRSLCLRCHASTVGYTVAP